MTYLTRWRMLTAPRLLKNEGKMETMAGQHGYESAAAFRKAFKREMGIPPAQYRKFVKKTLPLLACVGIEPLKISRCSRHWPCLRFHTTISQITISGEAGMARHEPGTSKVPGSYH